MCGLVGSLVGPEGVELVGGRRRVEVDLRCRRRCGKREAATAPGDGNAGARLALERGTRDWAPLLLLLRLPRGAANPPVLHLPAPGQSVGVCTVLQGSHPIRLRSCTLHRQAFGADVGVARASTRRRDHRGIEEISGLTSSLRPKFRALLTCGTARLRLGFSSFEEEQELLDCLSITSTFAGRDADEKG